MDCVHFGGEWVREATGRDPIAPWRGRYSSILGAKKFIRRNGGLFAMVSAEMARCGFDRTTRLEHGDVGLVEVPGGNGGYDAAGMATVICCGDWLIARGLDGLFGLRVDPIAAWRVLK